MRECFALARTNHPDSEQRSLTVASLKADPGRCYAAEAVRCALGCCVAAPNVMKGLSSGTLEAYLSALFHANNLFGGQP